jgi:ABC-2 type transport system ATP-binding protein
MHALQAVQLSKQYKGHAALNNLNLTVNKGEVFCLLGQNGAGKTTTLNIFLGFISASGGTASINGVTVSPNNNETKKYIAYIPEMVMLYGQLTGLENLGFFSRLAGYQYKKEQLQDLLQKAGLQPEAFSQRVSTYSKGMRQKVGIAIAIAKDADVIFMDEPTSGLDPKATNEFTGIVQQLGRQGKAVLMATHDIFNAVNVASTIGIMKQGQLIHILRAKDIDAQQLQQLYLETI